MLTRKKVAGGAGDVRLLGRCVSPRLGAARGARAPALTICACVLRPPHGGPGARVPWPGEAAGSPKQECLPGGLQGLPCLARHFRVGALRLDRPRQRVPGGEASLGRRGPMWGVG